MTEFTVKKNQLFTVKKKYMKEFMRIEELRLKSEKKNN